MIERKNPTTKKWKIQDAPRAMEANLSHEPTTNEEVEDYI